MSFTQSERRILRDLARRQADIAALPVMAEREVLWYDLNDGKAEHPLVTMEFHGLQHEVYPPLTCESPLARTLELQMTRNIFKHDQYGDDRVIPASLSINACNHITPFGFTPDSHHAKAADGSDGMGYMFAHAVHDLAADFHIFQPSAYAVDAGLTKSNKM